MSINAESSLSSYLIRMDVSIPANTGNPQTLLELINQVNSFFNKRPELLNNIVTVKLIAAGDFKAGTINAAGDGFEPETVQSDYLTTDPAPYQEPFVGTVGLEIEAFISASAGAIAAVACCYMGDKATKPLPHTTVEVPS